MFSITRKFEFDAAHRVLHHEGKCKYLHGHRYVTEVTFVGGLDNLGRVLDFSELKKVVGGWIDENWDHNIILHPQDPLLRVPNFVEGQTSDAVFGGRHPYVMPEGSPNPTAENMAAALYVQVRGLIQFLPVAVLSVRLYETPNCWSDYPCNQDSKSLQSLEPSTEK